MLQICRWWQPVGDGVSRLNIPQLYMVLAPGTLGSAGLGWAGGTNAITHYTTHSSASWQITNLNLLKDQQEVAKEK